jgi:hypothetical protein
MCLEGNRRASRLSDQVIHFAGIRNLQTSISEDGSVARAEVTVMIRVRSKTCWELKRAFNRRYKGRLISFRNNAILRLWFWTVSRRVVWRVLDANAGKPDEHWMRVKGEVIRFMSS